MAFNMIDFSFAFQDQVIFDQLNLELPKKGITLLYGANGSGKTTLCRLITGLQKGYRGSLIIDGKNLTQTNTTALANNIVYLKQNAELNILAATPNIDLNIWYSKFNFNNNESQIDYALSWFDLTDLKEQPVWELSGGQLQRLALASLVLNISKFWLLDEPAAGLDKIQQLKLIELLKIHDQHNGALIISHRLALFAGIADNIFEIKKNKIEKVK